MNTGDLVSSLGADGRPHSSVLNPVLGNWQPWHDDAADEKKKLKEQWTLFVDEVPLDLETLKFLFLNGFKTKASLLTLNDISLFESVPSFQEVPLGNRNELKNYLEANCNDRVKSISRANTYRADDSRLSHLSLDHVLQQAKIHFAKLTQVSDSPLYGMIEKDDTGRGDYSIRGQRGSQGKTRIYFTCLSCSKSISVKPLARKNNDVGFTMSNVLTHIRNAKHSENREQAQAAVYSED